MNNIFEPIIGKYCIVTSNNGEVFFGKVDQYEEGKLSNAILLKDSRRICRWAGACSISQLANEGTLLPTQCELAQVVPVEIVWDIIEVIPCTEEAIKILKEIPLELRKDKLTE